MDYRYLTYQSPGRGRKIAGVKPADNIDGISFVPTLLGESAAGRPQAQHEYLYWESDALRAVRMGDWKAVKKTSWELYDLNTDISETTNVAGDNQAILDQMIAYADQAHTTNIVGAVLDGSLAYTRDGTNY